jgi:hypothetical protein
VVNWFIVEFDLIRRTDRKPDIQCGAALALDMLLDWALRRDEGDVLNLPDGGLSLTELHYELAPGLALAQTGSSQQIANRVAELRAAWGDQQPESSPGEAEATAPDPDPPPQ